MTETSMLATQTWAEKDQRARDLWFNDHSDAFARERGAFIIALEKYAKAVKSYGANEMIRFTVDDMMDSVLNTADAALAPEVREWFE